MRYENTRFKAREHERVDVGVFDARPQRRERSVQVIAHGRREHDIDALFLGEVLENTETAARDVRLEEQRAVLPAREAETARGDIEEQRWFLADNLILFEEVMQGKEFIIDLFRHVGDVEAEACAHVEEVEDAEAVLGFTYDGRRNRIDLLNPVIEQELAEALQNAAELVNRGKREPVRAEDLLAERQFLVGRFDNFDFRRSGSPRWPCSCGLSRCG